MLRTWPGYVDLSSAFQGAEGWLKLILALVTLIPHLLPVKIRALALDVSPASLVYVVYHSSNFYFFMKTRQARAHEAALKLTREDFDTYSRRYHRYVHRIGYLVYGLIAITIVLKLWSQISDLPAVIQRLARLVGIHT